MLSYVCASSYLRATKWTWQKSIERLEQTLKWRREFGIYDLVTADHVEPEVSRNIFSRVLHRLIHIVGSDGKRNTLWF
jgi:hypothetical protein